MRCDEPEEQRKRNIFCLGDGPRTGYFKRRRNRQEFAPPSPGLSPLLVLFVFWRGWIGFNCGSIVVKLDHGPREYHSSRHHAPSRSRPVQACHHRR